MFDELLRRSSYSPFVTDTQCCVVSSDASHLSSNDSISYPRLFQKYTILYNYNTIYIEMSDVITTNNNNINAGTGSLLCGTVKIGSESPSLVAIGGITSNSNGTIIYPCTLRNTLKTDGYSIANYGLKFGWNVFGGGFINYLCNGQGDIGGHSFHAMTTIRPYDVPENAQINCGKVSINTTNYTRHEVNIAYEFNMYDLSANNNIFNHIKTEFDLSFVQLGPSNTTAYSTVKSKSYGYSLKQNSTDLSIASYYVNPSFRFKYATYYYNFSISSWVYVNKWETNGDKQRHVFTIKNSLGQFSLSISNTQPILYFLNGDGSTKCGITLYSGSINPNSWNHFVFNFNLSLLTTSFSCFINNTSITKYVGPSSNINYSGTGTSTGITSAANVFPLILNYSLFLNNYASVDNMALYLFNGLSDFYKSTDATALLNSGTIGPHYSFDSYIDNFYMIYYPMDATAVDLFFRNAYDDVIMTASNYVGIGSGGVTCQTMTSPGLTTSVWPSLTLSADIGVSVVPHDIVSYGDTLYVLTNGLSVNFRSINANTNAVVDTGYFNNLSTNRYRISAYNGFWYFTESIYVHRVPISSPVTIANMPLGSGNNAFGLFITQNGILYVGTVANIRAYDLNDASNAASLTRSLSDYTSPNTEGRIQDLIVENNIIYAANYTNNRISTFNALTGAVISQSLISLTTRPNSVEKYGNVLFVAHGDNTLDGSSNVISMYNASTGELIKPNIIAFSGIRGMCIYNNFLYVTCGTDNTIKKYDINSIGYGSVSCGAITTNNNNISAGTGTLTCGNITISGDMNMGDGKSINFGPTGDKIGISTGGELTIVGDNYVDIMTAGVGKFRIYNNTTTGGPNGNVECGAITANGSVTVSDGGASITGGLTVSTGDLSVTSRMKSKTNGVTFGLDSLSASESSTVGINNFNYDAFLNEVGKNSGLKIGWNAVFGSGFVNYLSCGENVEGGHSFYTCRSTQKNPVLAPISCGEITPTKINATGASGNIGVLQFGKAFNYNGFGSVNYGLMITWNYTNGQGRVGYLANGQSGPGGHEFFYCNVNSNTPAFSTLYCGGIDTNAGSISCGTINTSGDLTKSSDTDLILRTGSSSTRSLKIYTGSTTTPAPLTCGAITATGQTVACGTINTSGDIVKLSGSLDLRTSSTSNAVNIYGGSSGIVVAPLNCGALTSTTITTNSNNINAGTGTLTCGTITTSGDIVKSTGELYIRGTALNLCNTSSTADIPLNCGTITIASGKVIANITGNLDLLALAGSKLNVYTYNGGLTTTPAPVNCGAITTNNNNINAGTGTLTCGVLTSTTITTNNNSINAGNGMLYCGGIQFANNAFINCAIGNIVSDTIKSYKAGEAFKVIMDINGYIGTTSSSRRFKTNIKYFDRTLYENSIEMLYKYRAVTYNIIKNANNIDDISEETYIGYIAEDFDEAGFTHFVCYDLSNTPINIQYDRIVMHVIDCVKEINENFNNYKTTNNATIKQLDTELQETKELVASQQLQINTLTQELADLRTIVQSMLSNAST